MTDSAAQRLLIIDDHPLVRRGVMQLVQRAGQFEVVGEASSGQEGIEMARRLAPDMVLLDLNMKDMSGLDVLKVLKSWDNDPRVVMLTVSDQAEDLIATLRAGADGYLLKEMDPEELVGKLKEAAAGQVTLSERLTRLLAHSLREDSRPKDPDQAGLTEQEGRILEQIALGKSNKLIARELNIAEGTVKIHLAALFSHFDVRNRTELATRAQRLIG